MPVRIPGYIGNAEHSRASKALSEGLLPQATAFGFAASKTTLEPIQAAFDFSIISLSANTRSKGNYWRSQFLTILMDTKRFTVVDQPSSFARYKINANIFIAQNKRNESIDCAFSARISNISYGMVVGSYVSDFVNCSDDALITQMQAGVERLIEQEQFFGKLLPPVSYSTMNN